MAVATEHAAIGLAALAAGATVCGHETATRIVHLDDGGKVWCGRCARTYAAILRAFLRDGDEALAAFKLTAMLRRFLPRPDEATITANVADAVTALRDARETADAA